MPLTGIDKRQVQQLASRGWGASQIAHDLELDEADVIKAMPLGIVDRLAQSEDGWLLLDSDPSGWALWAIKPSKKEGYYSLTITPRGRLCTCESFRYRNKCTHADQGEQKILQLFPQEGLTASTAP